MATTGNIKNMHYDFKQRLNRIDSNAYVGLRVPEIDRALNRAIDLYMLLVAEPRLRNQFGFEKIQRTIDDISIMVKNDVQLSVSKPLTEDDYYNAILPNDYLYYLSTGTLLASNGTCQNVKLETSVIKHNNRSENNTFYKSDFDWRECNIRFFDGGIKIFNEGFTVTKFTINYLKKHPYVHNAEAFNVTGYKLPDSTLLTGYVDCILPDITHSEIVDLAVLMTTGDLDSPMSYQFKNNILRTEQFLNN